MRPVPVASALACGLALAFVLLPVFSASGQVVVRERVEISAPILPRTSVIYKPFPSTLDGEKTMAHDAALLFDWLLGQCAPLYPKITVAQSGQTLSAQQLATNYGEVGTCANQQYSAKPYWIPKLVDDVDICGTEMGPDWRLITEADVASLNEADFQALADKWSPPGSASGLSFFFSALRIWVRASDGTIQAGTLAPGVGTDRIKPLGLVGPQLMDHYEGELALRCIRRTELPPGGDDGGGSGGRANVGGGGGGGGTGGVGGVGGQAGASGGGGEPDAGADATGPVTLCDGITMPSDHPNAARDYTTAPGVVNDRVTGLTWESEASTGNDGFVERQCAMRNTGGLDGWRRPTLLELGSIVDYAAQAPAIDRTTFPGTASEYFATGTPLYQFGRPFGFQGYGWSVDFKTGFWINGLTPTFQFRCVRDATPHRCYRSTERFRPTASSAVEAVSDAFTGLTWQRGLAPQAMSWENAQSYCDGLGGGYRLPGVKELLSLFDSASTSKPAIDALAFPGTPVEAFWSATRVAGTPSKVLAVGLAQSDYILMAGFDDTSVQNVRCVR